MNQKLIEEILDNHFGGVYSSKWRSYGRCAITEYAERSAAPEANAEPVAWIVQAKDAPLAPKYLVWEKGTQGMGMARGDQCNYTPLYSHPPADGMVKDG